MSLLSELKRRNVFKVSAAYLALSWVVIEVTGAVVPALHLPETIPSIVVWLGLIGFPFAVVFSWVYELTPDGLRREREVDRAHSIASDTGRRLDHLIIGLMLLAICLFVVDRLAPRAPSAPSATQPLTSADITVPKNDNSIAVLPFVNMSEDAGNAFFADGISEELLNLLARIPQLRVIARTSSFSYRDKEVTAAQVARELGVAHLLEGSVRKAGNRVRITAQLIRASDSSHLWSETYDRDLTDIFAVQDDIAGAVVQRLRLTLLGEAPRAHAVDPVAYSLFLQAREYSRQFTREGYAQSEALYRKALEIEPGYAAAWSGLALDYSNQTSYGMRPPEEGFDVGYGLAREAASRAIELDPASASTLAVLGDIAMFYDGDLRAAAGFYRRALALDNTSVDIISSAGLLAQNLDRLDAAVALQSHASARDPLNSVVLARLAWLSFMAGRLDEAIAAAQRALDLGVESVSAHFSIGMALLLQGHADAALEELRKEAPEPWGRIGMPMVLHALGRHAEAEAALAELIATQERVASYNIAYTLAYLGQTDRAFEWLDKAVSYHDTGLSEIVAQPLFANIRNDPRWLQFLRGIGKAPEQLAAIEFDIALPK